MSRTPTARKSTVVSSAHGGGGSGETQLSADKRPLIEQLGNAAPLTSGALPTGALPDQRVTTLANPSETLATFSIYGEDHTLGNAVRYICMRDKRTALCGYSIPHPSEFKINVRLQTYDNVPASVVLSDACDTLGQVTNAMESAFNAAEQRYTQQQAQNVAE